MPLRRLRPATWSNAASALMIAGTASAAIGVGQVQLSTGHPFLFTNPFVIAGMALLGIGAIFSLTGSLATFGRWRADRHSPFELVYDPTDPECLEWNTEPPWQQVRIKVAAKRQARDVRLRIVERYPAGRRDLLHLMHDNSAGHPRSQLGETCAEGDALYFDLALHHQGAPAVAIEYADESLRALSVIPVSGQQSLWFRVEASGRMADEDRPVRAATAVFRLDIGPLHTDPLVLQGDTMPDGESAPESYVAPLPPEFTPAPSGGFGV